MREITGHTRIFGILADPIHHVITPQVINAVMDERGFDGVLVPIHVGAADLTTVVGGLRHMRNLGGIVVTVPHKTAIVALCDTVTENARRVGAVNAVRREADGRLVGDTLDGTGFVAGLRRGGTEPRGLAVYLAGAGGAANAIAFALAEAGVARLTVANRTRARAEDLVRRIATFHPGMPVEIGTRDPAGHDLVVNATSLGLHADDPLPLDAGRLSPGQVVAEIIMQPETTRLLAAAAARGCRVHPGRPMLVSQRDLIADFLGMPR